MQDIQNLSVRIPKKLHRDVKSLCAKRGIALQFFIERAIQDYYKILMDENIDESDYERRSTKEQS